MFYHFLWRPEATGDPLNPKKTSYIQDLSSLKVSIYNRFREHSGTKSLLKTRKSAKFRKQKYYRKNEKKILNLDYTLTHLHWKYQENPFRDHWEIARTKQAEKNKNNTRFILISEQNERAFKKEASKYLPNNLFYSLKNPIEITM